MQTMVNGLHHGGGAGDRDRTGMAGLAGSAPEEPIFGCRDVRAGQWVERVTATDPVSRC